MNVPRNYERFVQRAYSARKKIIKPLTKEQVYGIVVQTPQNARMKIKAFYDEKKADDKKNKTCIFSKKSLSKKDFTGTIDAILTDDKHECKGIKILGIRKEKIVIHFAPKNSVESTINATIEYNRPEFF